MEKRFKRLIEEKIQQYLKIFGVILVTGPRFVGKTTLCQKYTHTFLNLMNPNDLFRLKNENISLIQTSEKPILIDEWQIWPNSLTYLKLFIDENKMKGVGMLTGSLWLGFNDVADPGIGRICKLRLDPLSLFESEDSERLVSLSELINDRFQPQTLEQPFDLDRLIQITCRGGFPDSVLNHSDAFTLNKNYLTVVINFVLDSSKFSFKKNAILNLINHLALITGQIPNWSNLITRNPDGLKISRNTLEKYLDILSRLFLIDFLPSYATNLSSTKRLIQKPKLYFCDPAIPLAKLNFTPQKLINNLNTFGFYFENLVYRDLKIYADYYGAELFYYRDAKGNEVDFIMELTDGNHLAIEVKLGYEEAIIQQAAKTLIKYKKGCQKMALQAEKTKYQWNRLRNWIPVKLIVITGLGKFAYKEIINDEEIYVIPIKALMP